jgi:RNA polymerase sigma-70 factor (ECF subfamily)
VFQAGQGEGSIAEQARGELLVRYHDAVYRYLCAKLGDSDAACELFSRFAERVVEIHPFLQRANPEKGRFRDYLKSVLSRMVIDYHRENQREQKKRREITPGSDHEPMQAETDPGNDVEFQKVWVEELMNHAWKGLEQVEKTKGQPYHSLLLYKAQNPQVRSEAMAQHFTTVLGKPMSAANIRQLLHRGQELLSDLLVEEVARSLRDGENATVSAERVEEELINLQLFDKFRRDALDRYRERTG